MKAVFASLMTLIALIGTVILAPAIAGVFGVEARVVVSGSMEPLHHVGDVVVVIPPSGDDLHLGEPVIFRASDDPAAMPWLHRVVALEDGVATTRGDANPADDLKPITQADVTGRMALTLTGEAARVYSALTSFSTRIGLIVIAVLLAVIAFQLPQTKTNKQNQSADIPLAVHA